MVRECINCKHSRGLGSDVWCGHKPKGKESYMFETDCEYYEPMSVKSDNKPIEKPTKHHNTNFIGKLVLGNGFEYDIEVAKPDSFNNDLKQEEYDNNKFWIQYNTCEFYDKNAERKCLAYDYRDCNQDMANRCKYAKMQSMSRHKGMADKIIFRWYKKSKFGTIELAEVYTEYANVKLNIDRHTFRFIYETFKEESKCLDEYGQPLKNSIVSWYEEDF